MMVSNKLGFFENGDFFPQTLGLFGPPDQILQNIYPKLGVASLLVHMHIFLLMIFF